MADEPTTAVGFRLGDRVLVYDDAGQRRLGTVVGFGTMMNIRQVIVRLDGEEDWRAYFEWDVRRKVEAEAQR